MSAPRVSIGMPVYNGEELLPETLDSVLAQTFEDFEVVISDNTSTDATPKICRAHAKRMTNVVSSDEPDARTRSCNHVEEGRRCSRLRTR
jgi:glycosyltransferase involved in cell wall biosynthesis